MAVGWRPDCLIPFPSDLFAGHGVCICASWPGRHPISCQVREKRRWKDERRAYLVIFG